MDFVQRRQSPRVNLVKRKDVLDNECPEAPSEASDGEGYRQGT